MLFSEHFYHGRSISVRIKLSVINASAIVPPESLILIQSGKSHVVPALNNVLGHTFESVYSHGLLVFGNCHILDKCLNCSY